MNTQNQIKRTLSTSTGIEYIKQLPRGNEVAHRFDLAKQVCTHFKFHDARGEMQTSGCQKTPRRLTDLVPLPVDVPSEVNSIAALELVRVRETE